MNEHKCHVSEFANMALTGQAITPNGRAQWIKKQLFMLTLSPVQHKILLQASWVKLRSSLTYYVFLPFPFSFDTLHTDSSK